MLTDRMTAKVLGLLVLVLTILIDLSCFLFARPETRQSPRFALIVAVTSVPLFIVSALIFRKASTMKEDKDKG
jgi:hypothetical protein